MKVFLVVLTLWISFLTVVVLVGEKVIYDEINKPQQITAHLKEINKPALPVHL